MYINLAVITRGTELFLAYRFLDVACKIHPLPNAMLSSQWLLQGEQHQKIRCHVKYNII